ncbi:MAG: beta-ketoacyl-[acyl-carrier-protein] synthase family protein [Pseudomonadota bacterium]
MRRVAVTGIGVVSPLGNDPINCFATLRAGRSCIRGLNEKFCERLAMRAAAPVLFDGSAHFPPPKLRMLDRVSQFALVAARQAVADSKIDFMQEDVQRTGVFLGTGMGGSQTTDEGYQIIYAENSDHVKPFSVLMAMNNAAASWIAIDHRLTGPNLTFSTACSSSAVAIGEAWRRIREGDVDIMLAGGAEAPLTFGTLKAWEALRTLATDDPIDLSTSCKPFSKSRTGMVLGEGAAILMLEEWMHAVDRGATIYAELVGYGLSTDSAHITRPTIEGQARAMQLALTSATVAPSAIHYMELR